MTTTIQAAIEALTRYEISGHDYSVDAESQGEYLLRSDVIAALQAAQPAGSCNGPTAGVAITDCRSDAGIATGLIDGIIAMSRVLRNAPDSHAVKEALIDLRKDEDVRALFSTAAQPVQSIDTAIPTWQERSEAAMSTAKWYPAGHYKDEEIADLRAHIAQRAPVADVGAIVDYIYEMVGSVHRDDLINHVRGMLAAPAPIADEVACVACSGEGMVWIDGCTHACAACQDITEDVAEDGAPIADEAPAAAPADALQQATDLAAAIWSSHYRGIAPQWKPLPDLCGVISQIDNMAAGMTVKAAPAGHAEPVAWRVAEFWSSAEPTNTVRMLAEGDKLKRWPLRKDFIRWVSAAPVAAEPAPGREAELLIFAKREIARLNEDLFYYTRTANPGVANPEKHFRKEWLFEGVNDAAIPAPSDPAQPGTDMLAAFAHNVLVWNREQTPPPITLGREYGVADALWEVAIYHLGGGDE